MKWILLLFLVLLVGSVEAKEFDLHDVRIDVQDNGDSIITGVVYLDTTYLDYTYLAVNPGEEFKAYDIEGDLEYIYDKGKIFVYPRAKEGDYSFTYQYTSSSLTERTNGDWKFNYEDIVPFSVDISKVSVFLPYEAELAYTDPEGFYRRTGTESFVDFYDSEDISLGYKYDIDLPISGEIKFSNPLSYMHIILFVLTVVLSLFIYFKHRQKVSKGQEDILKTLDEKQEDIIKLLIKNNGKMSQRNIRSETGIPKATLSRTLKYLKFKDILDIKKIGYTNMVFLSKWFKKK